MKRIVLKRMRLINFKSFRDFTVEFDKDVTVIQGRNASGKTTVFDAFTWLLFGKNSEDRKDFGIKTKDGKGNVIERLPHEVSAVLSVNGEEITLCRRLTEKWQKKRGVAVEEFTGHTEERLWNDVPCSVSDWTEKIEALCSPMVFKYITNPSYFATQKAEVQREMLFRMAGRISDDEIAAGNEDFQALLARLSGKTLEEYKKEIAAKKRRIKAEIDTIPDRIDERKRDMPEEEDWDVIEECIANNGKHIDKFMAQINDAATAYDAASEERLRLVKEISSLKQQRLQLESEIKSAVLADYNEAAKKRNELELRANNLMNEIMRQENLLHAAEGKISSCKAYREKLVAEWREINADKLVFNEDDFVCPTCRRPLDVDDIERKQNEMIERFNTRKAERLAENNRKGQRNKQEMLKSEEDVSRLQGIITAKKAELEALRTTEAYNVTLAYPDCAPAISANKDHQELSKRIAELEEQAAKPIVAADTEWLKKRIQEIQAGTDALKAKLAKREIIERNNARVAELEGQLRTQSEELAELEGIEFTIAEFTKAWIDAIDKRINGMFSLVRFKMYEKQINGGEAETCVATVDGIPYPDLNNATRINAGIDIINAICRYMDIAAPIFLDNCESVLSILQSEGQQVRLYVADTDLITKNNNIQNDLFNS